MCLGELVVADVHALHVLLGEPREHVGDLVRAVVRLEDKRQEDVRSVGCIVPVDKLGDRAGVDDVMQPLKAGWKCAWSVDRMSYLERNVGGRGESKNISRRMLPDCRT